MQCTGMPVEKLVWVNYIPTHIQKASVPRIHSRKVHAIIFLDAMELLQYVAVVDERGRRH